MPQIRAVLFDFGLVLSGPPDPGAWRRLQTILNTADPALHSSYWGHRHNYDLGVLSGVQFWRTVGTDVGHTPDDHELAQLLEADADLWTRPNQPMIDWAISLQSAGLPTGVLSNMGDAMEAGIFERCLWLSGFPHHTFSHRLRIAKPDERIYRHALSAIGHTADATLFVDDRIENIEAASTLGLHAVQYADHEAFICALQELDLDGLPPPRHAVTR